MTGFGAGSAALEGGGVFAEIRSVNQRFLDVRSRLPRELADLALFAEQVVRERLRRGRIDLVVRTEGSVLPPVVLDKARARAALLGLREITDELAPGAELPLGVLASVPDLFVPPAGPALETVREALKTAIERAVEAMEAMREREGAVLAADLEARTSALRALARDAAARSDVARDAVRKRLRERVERLLADTETTVDAGRLETELAVLADRADIAEELTRLGSHLDQCDAILASAGRAGEPVGRKLDFLLQELARETNTLGAKAQDAVVSQLVVAMKVELERMREQVQNVE